MQAEISTLVPRVLTTDPTTTFPAYEPTDDNLRAHLVLAHGLTHEQADALLARHADASQKGRDNQDDTANVVANLLEDDGYGAGDEVRVIPTQDLPEH